MFKNLL